MRVLARNVNWGECPHEIAAYTKRSQTFLTVGREYEVHGVAIFKGFPALQVVDDLRQPSWEASWLFDVVDSAVPEDWICNVFQDEPLLVMGPEFIARDRLSYGAMVELEADQVDRFWKRIDARRRPVTDEEE
jgi:hypothetical protein